MKKRKEEKKKKALGGAKKKKITMGKSLKVGRGADWVEMAHRLPGCYSQQETWTPSARGGGGGEGGGGVMN